jgi:hypothetical protein
MKTYFIPTIIIVLALIAGGIAIYREMQPAAPTMPEEETVFCAMDVMQCSDGSYVSRVPPSCAFAACPVPKNATSSATSSAQ